MCYWGLNPELCTRSAQMCVECVVTACLGDTGESQSPVCQAVRSGLRIVRETRWMVLFRWGSEGRVTGTIPDLGNDEQERRASGRGMVRPQCSDRACW